MALEGESEFHHTVHQDLREIAVEEIRARMQRGETLDRAWTNVAAEMEAALYIALGGLENMVDAGVIPEV